MVRSVIIPRIHYNSILAKLLLPKKYTAFTIMRHIYIKCSEQSMTEIQRLRLLAHEECHIAQYVKYGFLGFLFRYLWYSIKYGYNNNPLEVEARKAEDRVYQ